MFDTSRTSNLLGMETVAAIFSTAVYFFITTHMHVKEVDLFYKLIKKLSPIKKGVPYLPEEDKVV